MNWTFPDELTWSSRACLTLLCSVWQVALLALIARCLEPLFPARAYAHRYALNVAVLLAALVALPVTFSWLGTQRFADRTPAVSREGQGKAPPSKPTTNAPVSAIVKAPGDSPELQDFRQVSASSSSGHFVPSRSANWERYATSILAGYLLGVVVMWMRLCAGLLGSRQIVRHAVPITAGPAWKSLESLSSRWHLRSVPRLYSSTNVSIPAVIGLARPVILLPIAALSHLTPSELEFVLAHEVAHIRRYDAWVQLFQRLAETMLFFNPALWAISRRISFQRELCCDELTCRMAFATADRRVSYARALLRMAEVALPSGTHAADLVTLAADGHRPSELRRRVAILCGAPLRERLFISRTGILTIVAATLLLVFGPLFPAAREAMLLAQQQPATAPENAGAPKPENAAAGNPAAQPPAAPPEKTFPITVFGKAVNEDGRPLANAEVILAARNPGYRTLATTVTDAEGNYRFDQVELPVDKRDVNRSLEQGGFEVLGTAEGYALAWRGMKTLLTGQSSVDRRDPLTNTVAGNGELDSSYGTADPVELDLKFVRPITLRGVVVNDLGEPIPGTQLEIRSCEVAMELGAPEELPIASPLDSLNERGIVPDDVKVRFADENGFFAFNSLPPSFKWGIDVRPPGQPQRRISPVTSPVLVKMAEGVPVLQNDLRIVFPRTRTMKLRVIYGDTGEPASRVGVSGGVNGNSVWETTDADGLIQTQLPDGVFNVVLVPRYQTPYWRTTGEFRISEQSVKDVLTIELQPAAVVEIAVLDDATGEPIEGVDVWSDQQFGRPYVHGYRSWEVQTRLSRYESPRSGKDGKLRINFAPGRHRIGVGMEAYPEQYVTDKEGGVVVDCRSGEPTRLEFRLKRHE